MPSVSMHKIPRQRGQHVELAGRTPANVVVHLVVALARRIFITVPAITALVPFKFHLSLRLPSARVKSKATFPSGT
jgi:hypothetical protein